jgi:hypothetical protein
MCMLSCVLCVCVCVCVFVCVREQIDEDNAVLAEYTVRGGERWRGDHAYRNEIDGATMR